MKPLQYSELPYIAHENTRYLVVFKPRAMHTDGDEEGTLKSWLISQQPLLASVTSDAGLLQRLDFFTAGLLIAAKDKDTHLALKNLLQGSKITKQYLALIEGEFDRERIVSNYIGSPYRRAKKVRVYDKEPSGKHRALLGTTLFKPLHALKSFSVVQADAHVARRHQIRAQASYLGHPLIGDETYGSTRALSEFDASLAEGFFLFAHELKVPKLENFAEVSLKVEHPPWLIKLLSE